MRWANTGATRAMLLTLEHGNPATLTSSTPSHHEHSLRHYPPAVHITPHYARGQGSHAQCTRRTPRGRQESHVARRSAGGGHGTGANRRHSTRHGARGAAPRCEGHERHHGVKATVEIQHGWKTRCNASGGAQVAVVARVQASALRHESRSAFQTQTAFANPSNLPVSASVRHFRQPPASTRLYTIRFIPLCPANMATDAIKELITKVHSDGVKCLFLSTWADHEQPFPQTANATASEHVEVHAS